MQTILGANGTIGTLLAKELTAYTHKIRLVSRKPQKTNDTDELFSADLSDGHQVEKAIEGSKHGGVGEGLTPKAALDAGLKVDLAVVPKQGPVAQSSFPYTPSPVAVNRNS